MTETDQTFSQAGPRESVQNRLLAALPAADYQHLLPNLEPIGLAAMQTIYQPNDPISHVYFPTGGAVSLFAVGDGAASVGVTMIGSEGMLGLPIFLHAVSGPNRAICQIAGQALRLTASAFQEAVAAQSVFHDLLHRYTHIRLAEAVQGAACTRLHSPVQRTARWLLLTHDAVRANTLPLTQDQLALLLGLRRATVTGAAGRLRQAGAVRSGRGTITILDQPRLEAAACACYRIVRQEFERLLP